MRLYSTPKSALAGEVSLLAIVETLLAVFVSVYFVFRRGSLVHVAIGACVAPFLLLRTKESTRLAFGWCDGWNATIEGLPSLVSWVSIVAYLSLGPIALRVGSVAITAVRHPIESLRMIPRNWARLVLCTDLLHPPEVLPDIETSEASYDVRLFKASEQLEYIHERVRDSKSVIWKIVWAVGNSWSFLLLFWLPALAYRYSLKATALVYVPLLWVLHDSLTDESTIKEKLEDIKLSVVERLKRWYSGFVIVALIIAPAVLYLTVRDWWSNALRSVQAMHPAVVALFSAFIVASPTGLDIAGWHVARGINAFLTFGLFVYADSRLRQMERGRFHPNAGSAAAVNVALLIRGLLTLYVIGCTAWIVTASLNWKEFLPVRIRILP